MNNVDYMPEYNLREDAYVGSKEAFIKKLGILAIIAKPEDWNFKNEQFKKVDNPYPILYNYLFFTYDRLKQENKIIYTIDEQYMCFNTGLQTGNFERDIYAFCIRNKNYPDNAKQKWYLTKFCDGYDGDMRKFSVLPEVADYIENAADLVFDKNCLPIRMQYEHIIRDNLERFKVIGESDEHKLYQMLKGAYEIVQERVKRNYKVAIPQFYTDKNSRNSKIQLLLPLCMQDRNKADLALVVERDCQAYVGKTILPLDWAYMNSRRIVRPDAEWIISI